MQVEKLDNADKKQMLSVKLLQKTISFSSFPSFPVFQLLHTLFQLEDVERHLLDFLQQDFLHIIHDNNCQYAEF